MLCDVKYLKEKLYVEKPGKCETALATPGGFEPPISTVTGWHVRPLHHGARHEVYQEQMLVSNRKSAVRDEPIRHTGSICAPIDFT